LLIFGGGDLFFLIDIALLFCSSKTTTKTTKTRSSRARFGCTAITRSFLLRSSQSDVARNKQAAFGGDGRGGGGTLCCDDSSIDFQNRMRSRERPFSYNFGRSMMVFVFVKATLIKTKKKCKKRKNSRRRREKIQRAKEIELLCSLSSVQG
tara:strand:- start:17 stop:469 length:453 start_codon:yes stop_codon:yes gene_type:complete